MQTTLTPHFILKQADNLPESIFNIPVSQLHSLIPEPTLFHLKGKRPETLFVSVLLHGNEPTGFLAVQKILQKYQNQCLPKNLSLFFGNTQAAQVNQRRLETQPDYNRIWPGTTLAESAETIWAEHICAVMRERGVFASIDVHNNTGLNPHYACITKLDPAFLQLASLFGRLLVYFTHPKGVQSGAFAEFCPAVTLECGRPDQPYGIEHAFQFIDSCLHLHEVPAHPLAPRDVDLFHTVAQVCVAEHVDFSFTDASASLCLDLELERLNFTEIHPGTIFGRFKGNQMPLIAKDNNGQAITEQFFRLQDGELELTKPGMPAMLTLNEQVIRQDCLCYLMERLRFPNS